MQSSFNSSLTTEEQKAWNVWEHMGQPATVNTNDFGKRMNLRPETAADALKSAIRKIATDDSTPVTAPEL